MKIIVDDTNEEVMMRGRSDELIVWVGGLLIDEWIILANYDNEGGELLLHLKL